MVERFASRTDTKKNENKDTWRNTLGYKIDTELDTALRSFV